MSRAHRPDRIGAAAIASRLAIALGPWLLAACGSTPDEQPTAPPPPSYYTESGSHQSNDEIDPATNTERQQRELTEALRHMWRDHFFAAEESLRQLIETADVERSIRAQARAALVLLYLDGDNPRYSIERATTELDNLYLNARSDISESLLFSALQRAVENALRLGDEASQRQLAEQRNRKLDQEIIALQIALEKLRKLSLQ